MSSVYGEYPFREMMLDMVPGCWKGASHVKCWDENTLSRKHSKRKTLGGKSLEVEQPSGCNGMNHRGGGRVGLQKRCWLGDLATSRPR